MSDNIPIDFPAGYATGVAVGYASESGHIALVRADRPLPVVLAPSASPVAPLQGNTTVSALVGPYSPVSGPPVVVQLSGEWNGTVTLERSTDGGTTRAPITAGGEPWAVFTANACEPVWVEHEAAAELYLSIELSLGALTYRVSQ